MPILSSLSFGSRGYGFIGAVLLPPAIGQEAFTTVGTQSWTVPAGVTQISAVCVGGGGGASACPGTSANSGGGGATATGGSGIVRIRYKFQ